MGFRVHEGLRRDDLKSLLSQHSLYGAALVTEFGGLRLAILPIDATAFQLTGALREV